MQTVDLTPSPRILRMLGRIDFDLWRCIAELIDNSLDAFIDAERSNQPVIAPQIEIFLPSNSNGASHSVIQVNDNGPGMSVETLGRSLKAGLSNNDPFSKFGLFGMGFNIATARMGSHTEVLTTRAGDSYWARVTIDFDQLERQGSFTAPLDYLEKDDIEESGTKVIVSKLNVAQTRELNDPTFRSNLLKRLGRVYSRVLSSTRGLSISSHPALLSTVRITINGQPVIARPHCIWSDQRFQMKSANQRVSAVLPINFELAEQPCCNVCWSWLNDGETTCPTCEASDTVILRQRRIKGWIGLQRFGDQNDYGIDFIRNGRKIMSFDRTLFSWEDPITGKRLLEYPIDMNQTFGGRIVGEIELDHVAVTYQKDAFEKNDPGWREAITMIRGSGPLGPKNSEKYGYPINTSPFALFYSTFRRADPGLRDLVVKENAKAREWAEKFWSGDPEYQTDEKWYREAERFEISARGGSGTITTGLPTTVNDMGDEAEDSLEELLSQSTTAPTNPPNTPLVNPEIKTGSNTLQPTAVAKTERQLLEEQSEEDADYSRVYSLDPKIFPTAQPLNIIVRCLTVGKRLIVGGERLVLRKFNDTNQSLIIYDPSHPFFDRFEDGISDILLVEVASILIARINRSPNTEPHSLAHAYTSLKEQYDQERRIDVTSLAAEARNLLLDLQERSAELLRDDPARAFDVLSSGEQEIIYRRWLEDNNGSRLDRSEFIRSGSFLSLTPWSAFPRIVQAWPQPFLDGGFWNYAYEEINTGSTESDALLRQQRLERIVNLMHDVVWLTEAMSSGGLGAGKHKPHLVRCAQSLRLLRLYKVTV